MVPTHSIELSAVSVKLIIKKHRTHTFSKAYFDALLLCLYLLELDNLKNMHVNFSKIMLNGIGEIG